MFTKRDDRKAYVEFLDAFSTARSGTLVTTNGTRGVASIST